MADYRNFQPEPAPFKKENIEWTITYAFNAPDEVTPRVLLIGDSIANGYQAKVREKLACYVNVTFWATSKCLTHPLYFKELDLILGSGKFSLISFNNGLHSLHADTDRWAKAYRGAIRFIREKCPEAKLVLTLCTPLNDAVLDASSRKLNEITREIAAEEGLPTLDLYAAVESLNRDEHMSDAYHWKDTGKDTQAQAIADYAMAVLQPAGGNVQNATETGPDGAMK